MKKFIMKVMLFFALVATLDVMCGFAFNVLLSRAKYGNTYKNNYIANRCEDDIIILGSSHAVRHYVPSMIQDSLGLTCYNCGEPGCGIIPAYARYKMVTERSKPKLVIYEVTPGYDYLVSDDYSKYLGRVRQYSEKEPVAELYKVFGDAWEPLRLLSSMYRNNSCIVLNLMDMMVPSKDYQGYRPLYGELTEESIAKKRETQVERDTKGGAIDTLKLSYVAKLFADAKADNVGIVCIVSPRFMESSGNYQPAQKLCEKYGIPFIDNRNYEGLTGNKELFQDFGHMNDKGAKKYTASMMPVIRKYIRYKE